MATGKRAYSSDLRADQARRTRRQIVEAAGALFAERGYAATTIDAVAERAGVSRKTVFTAVGGKPVLIKLAYDWAVTGDDEPVPMAERPEIRLLDAQTDPVRMLEAYADLLTRAIPRVAPLYLALRSAADADPEARALFAEVQAERLRGMRGPTGKLISLGALRDGLSPEHATDLLFFYIDPSNYDLLVLRRGWSLAAYADWLASSMILHLLGRTR